MEIKKAIKRKVADLKLGKKKESYMTLKMSVPYGANDYGSYLICTHLVNSS